MQINQEGWNQRALAHLGSSYYDLESFRAGESSLRPLELEALGDVSGKDVLNLQCHIGVNAISWARRGANVTAVGIAGGGRGEGPGAGHGSKSDVNVRGGTRTG